MSSTVINSFDTDASFDFRILGPFEAWTAGSQIAIMGKRQRTVLAVLVLNCGLLVLQDHLIRAVWGDFPPQTARTQIHIAISKLRERLGWNAIQTGQHGYVLRAPSRTVDLMRFRKISADARVLSRSGQNETAISRFREALSLQRAATLLDLESDAVRAAALRVDEECFAALLERIGLEIRLGRYDQVIGELRELSIAHPMHERLHAYLAIALYCTDRQTEALEVCRFLGRRLRREFGIALSNTLGEIEGALLSGVREEDLLARLVLPSHGVPKSGKGNACAVHSPLASRDTHVRATTEFR